MSMQVVLTTALLVAHAAVALFHNNLAYKSPSRRHESLGVSLEHLTKRQTGDLFDPSELNFTHGVASGDPMSDSIILWTRLAPTLETVASDIVPGGVVPIYNDPDGAIPSDKAACVDLKVATDSALTNVVYSSKAYTTSDVDYTVKFEAHGLQPFTNYYYQFSTCNSTKRSQVGQTKTIPRPDAAVPGDIRLAVYSCSNYPEGYFNAYRGPVRKNSVDYILHLGDYIYEFQRTSSIAGRTPLPDRELYTLDDYRKRIATYRTDPDLLASHQRFPWITVWDDHEVANNAWRNGSADSSGDVFAKRKQAAVRAYFEWMPIRQVDMDDSLRIWRAFALGTLLDLTMLDTRHYDRDLTVLNGIDGLGGNSAEVEALVDLQNRTIMGFRQEAWFYEQLSRSSRRGAAWRLVGNQVVFSRATLGVFSNRPYNRDQWDGYLANRDRVYQHLADNKINNTVMLSGDSHASWVSDLVWWGHGSYDKDTGAGAYGVELAGTAVSSSSPVGRLTPKWLADSFSSWLVDHNDELQWQDLYYRGYFEMVINYDAINATYFGTPDMTTRNDDEVVLASFLIKSGENRIARNPTVGGGMAKGGALRNGKVQ